MAVLAKKASGGVKHKSTKEVENLKKKGGNKDKKIGKKAAAKNEAENEKKVTEKSPKKKAEPKEEKKPNVGAKRKSTEDVDTLKKNTEGGKKGGKRKRGGKKSKEAEKRKLEERMVLEGDLRKIYEDRKNARDARCLFVVMKDYEENVEFNKAVNARRKSKRTFFVDYNTPKQAKSMIKELEKREDVLVARSVIKPGEGADKTLYVNPCQLFMENIPAQVELSDLKTLFPTSSHIHYLSKKSFAKIYFADGKAAEEAFRKADNVVLKGSKMTVLYTSFGKAAEDHKKASPAKRQKVDPEVEQEEQAEEEEEEEDDDEDEDEDDDDDDEDEDDE